MFKLFLCQYLLILVQCELRDALLLVSWQAGDNDPLSVVMQCGEAFFFACNNLSDVKILTHTHVLGVRDNVHPYLMLTRYQNSCSLSMYPTSSIGSEASYVEELCSVFMQFSLNCWPVFYQFNSCLSLLILFLMLISLFLNSASFLVVQLMICVLLLVVPSFGILFPISGKIKIKK